MVTQKEVSKYLDALHKDGTRNMLFLGPKIVKDFNVSEEEATKFLHTWALKSLEK